MPVEVYACSIKPREEVIPRHFYQLDSLRGLAALAVILQHWQIIWKLTPHSRSAGLLVQMPPLRLFVAGHSAVMMFFVLSGFVLSLPQVAGKHVTYLSYLCKRTCRIYLPYLAGLGLSLLGCWKWHGMHTYGSWADSFWADPPQWKYIREHILFLGNYDANRYNGTFWTLIQEMRISVVFPLVCAAVLRLRARGGLLVALMLFVVDIMLEFTQIIPTSYSRTFCYTGMFVIGILLARYREYLGDKIGKLHAGSDRLYWGAFFVFVFVYAYTPSLSNAMGWDNIAAFDSITAIGAAGIILFSLADKKVEKFLLWRPISFLGRISYSLYLLHFPILLAFGHVFYLHVPPIVWLIPYVVTTISFAALMYWAVEAPSIRLGKALSKRIATLVPSQQVDHPATPIDSIVVS